MADHSKIEWTDATPIRARNLVTGKIGWHCEHASEGCRFCYAESINRRLGTGLDFKPGHRKDIQIFLDEKMLLAPLRWKKPRTIFVCSMTDLFADFVKDEWIDRVFAVMALCPQHRFQVLTKRARWMREYFARKDTAARWVFQACQINKIRSCYDVVSPEIAAKWSRDGLPNVWLGISAEDQARADERIPELLQTPAAVRFVSLEPLLGSIDLTKLGDVTMRLNAFTGEASHLLGMKAKTLDGLDWIIVGGESGKGARPMHVHWAREIRDQCQAAGIPFFFKQWGEWWDAASGGPEEFRDTKHEDDRFIRRGKKAAGRLLDGELHDGMPR
jgi:protein gp37